MTTGEYQLDNAETVIRAVRLNAAGVATPEPQQIADAEGREDVRTHAHRDRDRSEAWEQIILRNR